MPRGRSDDTSPGDARQPYSDSGGPAARHAETHDVRQEQLTNPKGPEPRDTSFDDDLAPVDAPGAPAGHADESVPASDDKRIQSRLGDRLSPDQMARLSVLGEGVRLEQGGVYVDLADLAAGPFKAIGGQEASSRQRYVAKRDTDHELWNRLVGDREPEVARPAKEQSQA
jgi:hypothetical protein